jgi:hypothetical protein
VRQGKAKEGGEGSGGSRGGAMRKWCVACALEYALFKAKLVINVEVSSPTISQYGGRKKKVMWIENCTCTILTVLPSTCSHRRGDIYQKSAAAA